MKEFELLPIPEVQSQQGRERRPTAPRQTTRLAVDVDCKLLEKVKDYAYWEGFTQQQIIMQALEHFFKDRKDKSRPAAVRNRPRVGRKPKHY